MVEELAALAAVLGRVARRRPRDALLARPAGVIGRACDGMVGAGVHTPNHRWKMASALLLADRLYPHSAWRAEAQAYLDEGIDIDADGEYSERSTGGYNHVCDRAMILIGRALGRQEYLEYADRNLRHMLYLIHPDGTLVTSYSRRQDRNKPVGIERYMELYWSRDDGRRRPVPLCGGNGTGTPARFGNTNPRLPAGAINPTAIPRLRTIAPRGSGGSGGRGKEIAPPTSEGLGAFALWLRYFADAAGRPAPPRSPCRRTTKSIRRRGRPAATGGRTEPDGHERHQRRAGPASGAGPEIGLRIAAGFAPDGQFVSPGIVGSGDSYSLRSNHQCVYFGPGPDRLPAVDYRTRPGFKRRVYVAAELTMTLEIVRAGDRVELHLTTEGCPGVAVEMALQLRGAEKVECDGQIEDAPGDHKRYLNAGRLTVTGPTHVLEIGPGAAEHDATELRGVHGSSGRDAVCIRLVTPIDHTLTVTARPRK